MALEDKRRQYPTRADIVEKMNKKVVKSPPEKKEKTMEEEEMQSIEAAIDASDAGEPAEKSEDAGAGEGADAPKEDAAPADGEASAKDEGAGEGKGAESAEPYFPSDELVERAVRAGLSLKEIMDVRSQEAMESILTKMGATAPESTKENATRPGDENPAGDNGNPLDGIPELSIDDGYDEGLVAAFNGLRALAIKQSETIASLAKAGESAKADSEELARIKAEAEAEAKKKEALEKRKNLVLAKPGGEGAARKLSTISGDGGEFADIIAGLKEKGLA